MRRDASIFDEPSQLSHRAPSTLRDWTTSRASRERPDLDPCAIHTAYLINLASADPKIAEGRSACSSTISPSRRRAACALSTRISVRTVRAIAARL